MNEDADRAATPADVLRQEASARRYSTLYTHDVTALIKAMEEFNERLAADCEAAAAELELRP